MLATTGWPWTADEAIAALTADVIARAPGAPAEFDEDTLRAELAGSSVRILLLPYLSAEDEKAARDANDAVDLWASGADITLITVTGVEPGFSLFSVAPTSPGEAERLLAHQDVDQTLRFAVSRATARSRSGGPVIPEPPEAAPTPTIPADADLVATVTAALRTDRVWTDPSLPPTTPTDAWSTVGADRTVRVAVLPVRTSSEPRIDLLTPLAAAFPDDIVMVITGRWIDIAGPDPQILRSSVMYLYGGGSERLNLYSSPFTPAQEVNGVCRRIGLLRTGVTTDQPAPTQQDPQGSVAPVLGWVFLGTAAVVGAGVWYERRRRGVAAAERTERDRRARRLERDRLVAALPEIASDLLALDGLARHGPARNALDRAAERYGVARDVLSRDGDLAVAAQALQVARTEIGSARDELARQTGTGR